jgi:hypothetical protein
MALRSAPDDTNRRMAVHEIATSSHSCTSAAELAAAAAAAVVAVAVAPAQAFASQPAVADVPAAHVPDAVVPDAADPGAFVPPAAAAAAGPEELEVASGQRKGLLLMHVAAGKQAGNWMGFPKRHHQKQALGLGSGHLAR